MPLLILLVVGSDIVGLISVLTRVHIVVLIVALVHVANVLLRVVLHVGNHLWVVLASQQFLDVGATLVNVLGQLAVVCWILEQGNGLLSKGDNYFLALLFFIVN